MVFVFRFFKLKRSVRTTSNTSNTSNTSKTMYFLSHEWSIGDTRPNFYKVCDSRKRLPGWMVLMLVLFRLTSCSRRHSRAIEHVRAITDAITDDAPHAREIHR